MTLKSFKILRFNLSESEMFVNFVQLLNINPMKTFFFKSNPNELSTLAILIQMGIFATVGLGSIIAIFEFIAHAR